MPITNAVILAAGIMFIGPDGNVLFLKRGASGDHAGEWCFPGGRTEAGETAEQTAIRETIEEIGFLPDGDRKVWARNIANAETAIPSDTINMIPPGDAVVIPQTSVDFTTFIHLVKERFDPKLCAEHVGFAWAPPSQPPEPLHPGSRIALAKLTMDELGIARAIASSDLTSPQRYENVSLFALRITGTGVAYRKKHNEFVHRGPQHYLNDEFLARCNGLPVIFEHPDKATLDSKEFNDRVIGTIVLPYIMGDEVWGIAKIYDDAAIEMMETERLSTSPAVIFRDPSVNSKIEMEDGSKLLIEGKPSLLDHLAICERGVWDKGGEPAGVSSELKGDVIVTEEEKKAAEEKARKDAAAGETLDKVLKGIDSMTSCVDSLTKRMDAFDEKEKAKADAEGKAKADAEAEKLKAGDPKAVAADKARKDAEENAEKEKAEKEEKERADKAKADAEDVRKLIADVESKLPKQMSDADYHKMADAQAKADHVFSAFGDSAPRPLQGETLLGYRKRMVATLKEHSPAWKAVDLNAIADEAAFGNIETNIYADAMNAALKPVDLPENTLREIVRTDSTGRRISTFVGQPRAWMDGFASQRRRLAGIRNKDR